MFYSVNSAAYVHVVTGAFWLYLYITTFELGVSHSLMLSHASCKPQPNAKDGWDSQAEDVISADENKTGFKDFIKQLPHRNTTCRSTKDLKGSLDRDSKAKLSHQRDQTEVREYYFC